MSEQGARSLKALAMTCALVAALGAAIFAGSSGSSAEVGVQEPYSKRFWEIYSNGDTFEQAMEGAGMTVLDKERIPKWLDSEVLGADFMEKAVSNSDASVVYFAKKGCVEDVGGAVEARLLERGWARGPSLQDEVGATYTKQEGECTWLTVESAQAGDEVAVVMHIRHI